MRTLFSTCLGVSYLLLFVLSSAAFGGEGGMAASSPAASGGESALSAEAESARAPHLHTVIMTKDRFYPAVLRIHRGDVVRWVNRSSERHTATNDPSQASNPRVYRVPRGTRPFDTGAVFPGLSSVKRFVKVGAYRYFCVFHQSAGMVGTILVIP